MKLPILLIFLTFCIGICNAQSSFKRLPKPQSLSASNRTHAISSAPIANQVFTAFRFTGPIAGYLYPQNQVVTGLGYGWQRLHFVDSTQKYYTDFGINAVVLAGGNVLPTLHPNNIISAGLELSVLNQLFMIGPVWNFGTSGKSGSIGLVFNISVPLN